MEIRKTTLTDLDRVMEIYAIARDFMANHGNPNQWGGSGRKWPPREIVENDIKEKKSYVCTENDKVIGVFFFDKGERIESDYNIITDGKWIGTENYGVVHRIAVDGSVKGTGTFCLEYALSLCDGHLRIDTHGDNYVMQNLLKKLGFTHCGTIFVTEDHFPRMAYEKLN